MLDPFPAPLRKPLSLGRAIKYIALILLTIQLCYMAATSLLIFSYRYVNPAATVLMALRAWDYKWKIAKPRPMTLRRVPYYIRSMLVAIEDGGFYRHGPISFAAFKRAEEMNARIGRTLYGGSTLTMQVARTLFLVPVKSYLRKYLEVITAYELEFFLTKNRILELYFGYAEWGKGIFGIEDAALHWYGRGVASLSRDEAARLIAILASPIRFGPYTLQHSGILAERYDYLDRHYVNPPVLAAAGAAATTGVNLPAAASDTMGVTPPVAGSAPAAGSGGTVATGAVSTPAGAPMAGSMPISSSSPAAQGGAGSVATAPQAGSLPASPTEQPVQGSSQPDSTSTTSSGGAQPGAAPATASAAGGAQVPGMAAAGAVKTDLPPPSVEPSLDPAQ